MERAGGCLGSSVNVTTTTAVAVMLLLFYGDGYGGIDRGPTTVPQHAMHIRCLLLA